MHTLSQKLNKLLSDRAELELSLARSLQKSILQEAIQGKLVPQIAEEGTAQELLEQIQQEKSQLIKEGKLKKSALSDSVIYKGDDNKYWEKNSKIEKDITDEIPFEIPDSWVWCRLSNLVLLLSGRDLELTQYNSVSNGIPYMTGASNFKNGILIKNRWTDTPIVISVFGDPTTEKEFPLVDAAEKAGCEYFVIDAGWYADGNWWDSVGEWQESKKRFPNGVREVTDYIRSKGMIPGVWLELEVMGINCKKASILPDECFFLRHGKRVYDRSRYQLDFRHPLVIEHVTEVIDRVVRDYGVGYIKMDYNIEPGIGTEVDADSFGDGLLEHERAYLAWLDGIYKKYPDLVIENCSSGGLRMDYAMLARNSIQSTSDQEDYRNYATISANAAIGVTPEQAAIWSYPLRDGTEEEVIFNMVNALLLRIHQSGHLAEISPERFELVKEGIDCYKEIRSGIKDGVPFWPMGWADNEEKHLAAGIRVPGDVIYLGVWRRGGEAGFEVPLDRAFPGKELEVSCIYPKACGDVFHYDDYSKTLQIHFPETYMARLFQIKVK